MPEARYARWRTTAVSVWAVIGILILVAASLWALGRISAALVPFVMAFIIVFLLNWPVHVLASRGVPRGWAASICFVVGFLVIGALMTLVGPPVGRQIVAFANATPHYVAQLERLAEQLESTFSGMVFPTWLAGLLNSASASISQLAVAIGNDVARRLVNTGSGVARGFFDLVIAVVIAFWALKDLPKLREEVITLAGPRYEDDAEHLIRTVTRVVGGYLKGQTIASFTTGALATIGLYVFGVPYALVIGLIAFIFNYVPYVGPFLTALIAFFVGLFISPLKALIAAAVIVAAQQITDNLVSPRVMSEQVDLHPTLVIFSLLVGGALFGIPGMLFAIPVAATGKGLFVYYYELQTQRRLATDDGALFKGASAECTPAAANDADNEESGGNDRNERKGSRE